MKSNAGKRFFFPTEEEPVKLVEPVKEEKHEEKVDPNELVVHKPTCFEDAKKAVSTMQSGLTTIVDIYTLLTQSEGKQIATRIIDYCCGAAQTLSYSVNRVNNTTFVFTLNPVKEIVTPNKN